MIKSTKEAVSYGGDDGFVVTLQMNATPKTNVMTKRRKSVEQMFVAAKATYNYVLTYRITVAVSPVCHKM